MTIEWRDLIDPTISRSFFVIQGTLNKLPSTRIKPTLEFRQTRNSIRTQLENIDIIHIRTLELIHHILVHEQAPPK